MMKIKRVLSGIMAAFFIIGNTDIAAISVSETGKLSAFPGAEGGGEY